MKTFISNSITSIILKFLFLLILLLIVICGIIYPIDWLGALIISMIYFLWFIFLFNSLFGYIKINDTFIYVPNDLTFKKFRIQHKEKIKIDNIVAIEFVEEECSSDGRKITLGYTRTPSYLKFIMTDNSIKRIYLDKYSYKTWIKIETMIINNNNDILVLRDVT